MINVQSIHSRLLECLLQGAIPKYMKDLDVPGLFYPAIVGGQNVLRCSSTLKLAKEIISNVHSPDVDIDIVFLKETETVLQRASDLRMQFIEHILSDGDFRALVNEIQDEHKNIELSIVPTMDTHMLTLPPDHTAYHGRVVRVRIQYYLNKYDLIHDMAIVDTGFFSKRSKGKVYNAFNKFVYKGKIKKTLASGSGKVLLPIPYEIKKGLYLADCNHAFYDTVRMILYYSETLPTITDPARYQFLFIKFTNLLLKYLSLHVIIHKIKSLLPRIKTLYDDLLIILSKFDMEALMPRDIPDEERQKVFDIFLTLKQHVFNHGRMS